MKLHDMICSIISLRKVSNNIYISLAQKVSYRTQQILEHALFLIWKHRKTKWLLHGSET